MVHLQLVPKTELDENRVSTEQNTVLTSASSFAVLFASFQCKKDLENLIVVSLALAAAYSELLELV